MVFSKTTHYRGYSGKIWRNPKFRDCHLILGTYRNWLLNCQTTPEGMKESREIYAHNSRILFIKTNSCFSATKSSKRVQRRALLNKTTNNLYTEAVVYSYLLLVLTKRRVNNKFFHNSFTYIVSRLWNRLPVHIKTSSTFSDFSRKLKAN